MTGENVGWKMMFDTPLNPKMKKRLEWIDKSDDVMIQWLLNYAQQHRWIYPNDRKRDTPSQRLERFLKSAHGWEEHAETREQCRNMKSAWKSWKKREDNRNSHAFSEGNYTISMAARKELERLAKRNNCSFSQVIDTLLKNAKELERLQRTLNKELEDTDVLATFFTDDKTR